MASGGMAYSDMVPLVKQPSLGNDEPQDGGKGAAYQLPLIQQPLSQSSVVALEDVFGQVVMSTHPRSTRIVRIEINSKSQAEAISKVVYRLRLFGEPRPSLKILTDVRAKEYTNTGAQADTVEMTISKKRETCLGSGFRFSMLQGLQMEDDHRIGPSIFNAVGNNAETLLVFDENDSISERVSIPPHTKTTVTVKTHLVKYEGEAMIDVHAPSGKVITYKYLTEPCCPCGWCCFSCCKPRWISGEGVTMGQLFRGQPNYKLLGPTVHYTAKYHFTYFGEQHEVEKVETKLVGFQES